MAPAVLLLAAALTGEMWSAIEAVYAKTLAHPFLTGLTTGKLSRDRFQFYLMQDAHYLGAFGEALRLLAEKAPRADWAATLRKHAEESIAVEKQLHDSVLASYGVGEREMKRTEMAPANYAYTNHLLATVRGGSFRDGLAAMLPCYWIYWEVGKELKKRGSPNRDYQRWIDQYADEGYGASVRQVMEMMDSEGEKMSAEERRRAVRLFVRSAQYEYMFWDMAWRKEQWP